MNQPTEIWYKTDSKPAPPSKKMACLTIIKGDPLGETFALDSENIILGRCNGATIILPDKGISRRHLLIEHKDNIFYASDLNSTNGSEINNNKITACQELKDGDKIRIAGTIFKFSYHDAEDRKYHQQLRELIVKDDLTQIYNKRYFMEAIEKEFNYARRNQSTLSLILFDIDHFKLFNDQYGHQAGDHVLTKLAELCQPVARNYDTFARFGGEEFALLLRETDLPEAITLANRLRQTIEDTQFCYKEQILNSTISLGISTYAPPCNIRDQHQLITIADHYLYQAKNTGRNKVCYEQPR